MKRSGRGRVGNPPTPSKEPLVFGIHEVCPWCRGKGRRVGKKELCGGCNGTGVYARREKEPTDE